MRNIIIVSRTALAVALVTGWTAQASAQEAVAAAAAQAETAQVGDDEVIVTGTRAEGITAVESAAPIKLLGEELLSHVGQPNLNQVLTQLVPSFTAQAFGGDTSNLTLSAKLRGLSPNHTLVLINGKRRHGTSNLAVLGGPYQGAATADLDLISPASIKRIEVLEDGAAAQYGSDAIAGVINIILKDASEGGTANFTAGETYKVGGKTYAGTLNIGTKIGENGFFNITGFYRYHDFTQIGGLDRRVTDLAGVPRTTLTAAQVALYRTIPGFPTVNKINGDARSRLSNIQYNTGYDFGDFQVYSFGTFSRRIASAYENLRVPDRVIRSPVLGVGATLATPGAILFDRDGFSPREGVREQDYALTGGIKGETEGGFHYDFSTTFGQDKNEIYTLDSANASLFVDTGFTPTTFYNGFFKASEFTANADFGKEVEIGAFAPANIAFGLEYRRNVYQIGSGDPGSIYKEGGQSYPGFRPSDAGVNDRTSYAGYLDIAAEPVEDLKVDGAVRYEHFSDFGSQVIFKLTSRYDFSDQFALRGTVATGFRAPTLAESFYSATNVSPTSAFVQLPANSAAAKLVGFRNLEPEKSTNFSLGAVARPAGGLVITLDAYQVRIKDRILGTGTLFSGGGATTPVNLNFPVVATAIRANGNILDPTVTQTGINIFTNGANTRTRGVDLVVSYPTSIGDGRLNLTLSGNYNKTKITKIAAAAPLTNTLGQRITIPLFDQASQSNLQTASPRVKLVSSAYYTLGAFSLTARGTLYGKSSNFTSPDGGTYYKQKIGTAGIFDLEANYKVFEGIELSIGANNLFNKRPPTVQLVPGTTNFTLVNGGNVLDAPLTFSPYGINGGYYYGRITVDF